MQMRSSLLKTQISIIQLTRYKINTFLCSIDILLDSSQFRTLWSGILYCECGHNLESDDIYQQYHTCRHTLALTLDSGWMPTVCLRSREPAVKIVKIAG